MTIKDLLEFVFTRGIPMVGVYWLLERPFLKAWLKKSEEFFQLQLSLSLSVVKRALAILFSVGLSVGAYANLRSLRVNTAGADLICHLL